MLGELAAQQLPVGWQAAGGLCSEEVPGEPGFSGHLPVTSTPAAAQLWIPKQWKPEKLHRFYALSSTAILLYQAGSRVFLGLNSTVCNRSNTCKPYDTFLDQESLIREGVCANVTFLPVRDRIVGIHSHFQYFACAVMDPCVLPSLLKWGIWSLKGYSASWKGSLNCVDCNIWNSNSALVQAKEIFQPKHRSYIVE